MALMILTNTGHVALAEAIYNSNIYLAWGDLPPFLGAPLGVTATPISVTSTLTATTYVYTVTATTINGETNGSNPVSVTLSSNGLGVNVAWPSVAGASGYNVYGRASGTGQVLLATNLTTTSWTDTGSASLSSANPPSTDGTSLTAWTSSVPAPAPGQNTLMRELGRRKCSLISYVVPDPNGSIQTANGRWTSVTYPTQYVYVYTAFGLTDASSSTIYQFGFFINTVPAPGNTGLLYLTPSQLSNPGTMLSLENVAPIHRDSSSSETHTCVMTF